MHHAFLLLGTFESALGRLPEEIRVENADVRHVRVERLGIDDARKLTEEASRMPVAAPMRSFVVAFGAATVEAQNALLKTLEEPALTSRFYVIVQREEVLMKTVRSRLMLLIGAPVEVETLSPEAKQFLQQSPADRLALIAERAKAKDTAWMEAVLSGLEQHAHTIHDAGLMRAIVTARTYFDASGASKKMLLEHVVLSISK